MPFTSLAQFKRGAVVLIPFPFTDLTNSKLRPAVLITDPATCPGAVDGHFVFLTTQPPPNQVPVVPIQQGSKEANAMGLRYQTGVRVAHILPTKLATLHVGLVQQQIGNAPAHVLNQVLGHLATTFGCSPLPRQPAGPGGLRP